MLIPRLKLLLLLVLVAQSARAQQPASVLDWRASTTLSSYLLQEMHRQYAPRAAELTTATASAAGMRIYQDSVRARFRRVMGPLPARTPLRAQVTGTIVHPLGLRIDKIVYESTPHHHVTANLYVPRGAGPWPGVLLLCGHEPEAKATVSYQKTALLFAENGFVVLVIDPISQGERMQLTDANGRPLARGGTTEHTLLNAGAALLGQSTAGEELWDNVRGLDYLLTRPEVDTARIGCLGNSGGATQTAYLMGLDERVKVAALCSYVASGERNLELTGPADGCVQLPGAGRARLDLADWPILFAPNPLLLLAGRYDFVDFNSIAATYAETHRAYTSLNQPTQVGLFTHDDGHGISQPKREAAVAWFRRWLCHDARPVREGALPTLSEAALRCTSTGQVNTAYIDEQSLAAQHLAQASALAARRRALPAQALAEMLRQQLCLSDNPAPQLVAMEKRDTICRHGLVFQPLILRREGEPPLPALLLLPKGKSLPKKVIIWLPGQGKTSAADSTALLLGYQQEQAAVLMTDLRGLGETTDPASFNDPKYYNSEYRVALLCLHIGRPLLAQRVADIQTLLLALQTNSQLRGLPVVVRASGRAAEVALHAAVVFPTISRLVLARMPPSYTEAVTKPTGREAYSPLLPGVLHYYDLPDLQRALGVRLSLTAR